MRLGKIFNKSIQAMEHMSKAYGLLRDTWDEADDEGILHLFDGAMVSKINEAIEEADGLSYDEAQVVIDQAIYDLKEIQVQVNDSYIEHIWEGFGDNVHINEDDETTSEYYHWDEGTHRQEIWTWFDEQHSKGVAYLMGAMQDLEWAVPTSVQRNQDGILKYSNKDFEIRLDNSIWLLIHKKTNRRWTREGVDKSDTMKAIAVGFITK